jgi:hypothetical protein
VSTRMHRLERIVADLPEAERVDIAEGGDHPTFRVRGKNFVLSDPDAAHVSVKLSHAQEAAVVATDPSNRAGRLRPRSTAGSRFGAAGRPSRTDRRSVLGSVVAYAPITTSATAPPPRTYPAIWHGRP